MTEVYPEILDYPEKLVPLELTAQLDSEEIPEILVVQAVLEIQEIQERMVPQEIKE